MEPRWLPPPALVPLWVRQPLPERGLGALAHRVGADANDPQDIGFSGPILARLLKEIHAIGRDHRLATLLTQTFALVRASPQPGKDRIEPLDVVRNRTHDPAYGISC